MKRWLLKIGIVLPLLSIFLWAGFDVQWWVQIERPDFGASTREVVLLLIHIVTPAICLIFYLEDSF